MYHKERGALSAKPSKLSCWRRRGTAEYQPSVASQSLESTSEDNSDQSRQQREESVPYLPTPLPPAGRGRPTLLRKRQQAAYQLAYDAAIARGATHVRRHEDEDDEEDDDEDENQENGNEDEDEGDGDGDGEDKVEENQIEEIQTEESVQAGASYPVRGSNERRQRRPHSREEEISQTPPQTMRTREEGKRKPDHDEKDRVVKRVRRD